MYNFPLLCSVVRHQFNDWKKTLWDRIDTETLITACKALQREIEEMPLEIRNWEVYKGLVNEVKNLLIVLPLVTLLSRSVLPLQRPGNLTFLLCHDSKAMQERHWRELKKSTGKNFVKDANFCLSDLLDLELHKFVEEVEYIVDMVCFLL